MSNNPLIYNGALNGATGGIHERWITSTQSADYLAIRARILDFADTVDQLIPTDPAIGEADGALMESIVAGVLADRFINLTDDFLAIAQAIVTLWNVMRGSLVPIATDTSSDNVIIDVSLLPPDGNQFPGGGIDLTLTEILIADGPYSGPGTGFPGWLSRYAWVNAASPRIGTAFAGVNCTAAPTAWLTESDVPPGNIFWFRQWGSGAGGGSGAANRGSSGTSSIYGGGGGGGAAMNEFILTRAQVLAQLPIFFTVPIRGLGGASVSSNTLTTVSGNPGITGTSNTISGANGLFEMAGGGSPGAGGVSTSQTGTAGSGGGRLSDATNTSTGGQPNDASAPINSIIFNILGGGRSSTRTTGGTGTAQYALYGGAGGGSNTNSSSTVPGGRSKYGGCGGGHGGRYSLLSGTNIQTSEGGNHDMLTNTAGGGGTAGTGNGEPGGNGLDGNEMQGGMGGGGGMAGNGNDGLPIGGDGGDGGFPGGGGGGGGGGYGVGGAGGSAGVSGNGGDGGDACTLLTILI